MVIKVVGNNSRKDNDKRNDQFHDRRKNESLLPFGQALRSKGTLNDILVQTPVVKVRDPDSQKERGDRKEGVGRGKVHPELSEIQFAEPLDCSVVGNALHVAGKLGGLHRGGSQRLGIGLAECVHGEIEDDRSADDKCRPLEKIGPGACFQTAGKDVRRRQDPDEPAEGVEVDRIAGKDPAGNPMLGEDDIEVFGAGVGDRSEIDRD